MQDSAAPPPRAVVDIGLVRGLPPETCDARIVLGLRLEDVGKRILAFYLADLVERRAWSKLGYGSIVHYAAQRLGMDRRRVLELVRIGRKLEDLPRIDEAFREQQISWSKIVLLARVVTPEVEDVWLAKALEVSCQVLKREVALVRPGKPPRKPGDRKGTPAITFDVKARLSAVASETFEQAKRKLAAERGHAVGDAEAIEALSRLVLETTEDGSIPGRTPVDPSAYRVVFHAQDGDLLVQSPLGPVPVDVDPAVLADAEKVVRVPKARTDAAYEEVKRRAAEDLEHGILPPKTPAKTRGDVLLRDEYTCRDGCGEHENLHVHHVIPRAEGGPTDERNLLTKAPFCHGRAHAGLMKIEGDAENPIYTDADGRPLLRVNEYDRAPFVLTLPTPAPPSAEASPGAEAAEAPPPRPDPVPPAEAFAGLVGLDDVLGRLTLSAQGSLALGRPFPHTLLLGPPGAGKTTIAKGLAAVLGARLARTSGPMLESVPALLAQLFELEAGDVLFLDEIHAAPRAVLEVLYEAMEEGQLSLGGAPKALPAFTLLAATTEEGGIPDALRDRFGIREDLGFRTDAEIAELLLRAAAEGARPLTEDGAARLAPICRGTPRRALRLLERVREHVAARERKVADAAAIAEALEGLGFDADGLETTEQRYLEVLRASRYPLSIRAIAGLLRTSIHTVASFIEPHLLRLGLVTITSRGRMATTDAGEGPSHLRLWPTG